LATIKGIMNGLNLDEYIEEYKEALVLGRSLAQMSAMDESSAFRYARNRTEQRLRQNNCSETQIGDTLKHILSLNMS